MSQDSARKAVRVTIPGSEPSRLILIVDALFAVNYIAEPPSIRASPNCLMEILAGIGMVGSGLFKE